MTIQLKRNDTKDTISYVATYPDGTIVDLTGASVRFIMGKEGVLITNSSAVVTDAVNGAVEYTLTDADTLAAGTFKAEFEVTFSDGKVKTFPNNGYLLVNIQPNIDKDLSTYVEDRIALRVSEVELFKDEVNTTIDTFTADINSTVNSFKTEVNSTVDNFGTRLDSVEAEQVDQDARIDNIVAQAGTDNTELVDARLGADNIARPVVGDLIREIHAEHIDQAQQTATLQHGLSVIESDQASPLKVEFYGQTLVNNFPEGDFKEQGKWSSNLVIDSTTYKFGTSSGKIDNSTGSSQKYSSNDHKMYLTGKYVLLGVWAKSISGTSKMKIVLTGHDNADAWTETKQMPNGTPIDSTWKFYYVKLDLTASTSIHWRARVYADGFGTANDVIYFDGLFIYSISADTYDKIGVSLTDADVERLFPYVNSVQHIKNPVLRLEGENLLPPFSEWTLRSTAFAKSTYEMELNASGAGQDSYVIVTGHPSTQYTFTWEGNGICYVDSLKDGDLITRHVSSSTNKSVTFTTPSGVNQIRIFLGNGQTATGTFTFKNPMLNLGSTAKPFVPRNPSYLYAETVLAGNDNKKDILYYNADKRRWEVQRNFEIDYKLDSTRSWSFSDEYSGYKMIELDLPSSYVNNEGTAVKYDGSILKTTTSFPPLADEIYIQNFTSRLENDFAIGISDNDSGWGSNFTPNSDEIKAYFNGWKANSKTSDGTRIDSWESLVDGSAPSTNDISYVSSNQAPNYKNYFLSYQRATSVIEPVTVEGDVSIQGDAQITVGELVQTRELATPYTESNWASAVINDLNAPASLLQNKADEIIAVYKNGELDNKWTIESRTNSNGKFHLSIPRTSYDANATYEVTYIALNEGQSANLNEVKATFANSLKSSFQSVVSKQSDIATDQSILKRQMLDVLIRLEALEGVN